MCGCVTGIGKHPVKVAQPPSLKEAVPMLRTEEEIKLKRAEIGAFPYPDDLLAPMVPISEVKIAQERLLDWLMGADVPRRRWCLKHGRAFDIASAGAEYNGCPDCQGGGKR